MKDTRPSPTKDAAEELGLSRRRVRQMKRESSSSPSPSSSDGRSPSPSDGTIDPIKEMARLRRLEKEATIKLREAQEQQIQVGLKREARIAAGELIHADVAVTRFVGALIELRTRLSNLPDRLAHQLRPDDPDGARKIVWQELSSISELVQRKIEES